MPETPMTDPSSFALDETAVGSVEQIEEEPRPDYILPENALISERYQLEKCLGEGGMGVVYRARHVLMKKTVALKVLHPEFTRNDEVVARFKREAQAAANIEHPNICLATDFGQTDEGLFYLVMEHLEGETLQSTIETLGKLTPRLTIHIGKQICAALAQAHQTGVVHRDLKPENIMLVERDDDQYFVKIMDFGIARVRMDEEHDNKTPARLTKAGMVYGTPHYMSPEQVVGGDIDSRADLYALGVVLFEMVTGRLPFEAKSLAAIMGMHVTQRAPRARKTAPAANIPPALDEVIAALMEKPPEERPKSAEVVRQLLKKAEEQLDRPGPRQAAERVRTAALPVLKQAEQLSRPVLNEGKRLSLLARNRFLALPFQTRAIITAAAASLLVLTMVFVWSGSRFEPEAVAERAALSLSAERDQYLSGEEVAAAIAKADKGSLDDLHQLRGETPDNPHLAYYLATHHGDAERWEQALQFYGEALDLDERYLHEPRLNKDVFALFEGRSAARADAASKLLARHPSPLSTARIESLAREGETRAIRKRAHDVLQESGQFDKLDEWSRVSIELRQASGCNAHREKIRELAKINDKRSLPALEAIEALPRRGCGFLKQNDCYACLRDDVKETIDKISKR